ncbi:MAG: SDR family NAD(P)-dependent oxidoreductase [Acetobacteraceae bacterium]|nr:SDR family NAD(P)-dependent oxidoreductase [Acetobacteraceae bacterium]
MRFPLRGGVAVITGAASGIGAALAQAMAACGCNLALADVNAPGLEDVAERARSRGVHVSEHQLDVADADAVAALPDAVLAEHGRVSVLVNNAGVALGGRFEKVSAEDFEWLFSINFWGVVRMTRAFLPLLRREDAAQIVNLSSVFGIVAPPGQVAYAASKFAVRGFSEALRHELQDSPIGVTIVHPGGVRTAIDTSARRSGMTDAEIAVAAKVSEKLLRLPPEAAAERIIRGIERREKRVLVGRDARQIAVLQRVFPVGYWPILARRIERAMQGAAHG